MSNIAEVIEIAQERFNSIAPSYMKYDAEKGFAIQLLKNNDYLMSAAQNNPGALQQALTNVAAIGLSLNPAEKLAYLIPRTVKTKVNGRDKYDLRVFLEPSYMGFIRLATDSGSIEWINADVVHANDDFCDNGPGEKPTHRYNAFKDRGDMVGVYCCAKTKSGDYLNTIMDMNDLISIRDRSEAWKRNQSGPWKTDFKEMAKKTVIRNAFKTWPRTDERRMAMLAKAVHLSNENEGFEPIATSPKIGQFTPVQKEYFDSLIENSKALEMYCFEQSIRMQDEGVWSSLYSSFEKGNKGKYQKIVNELCQRGNNEFQDIRTQLIDYIDSIDDAGVMETLGELEPDVVNLLKSGLNGEQLRYVEELNAE